MARIWSVFSRGLSLIQLTWVAVLTLVVAVTLAINAPAAVVGAAVAVLLILTVASHSSRSPRHLLTVPESGPPREEQRLRGAFRRQSAPDAPGRPRRPRAPGRIRLVA